MAKEARKAEIERKVKEIIMTVLSVDEQRIVPGASFTGDLNADSLEVVSLIMEFEQAFDLEIPDLDVEEKIVTVQDAIAYLTARLETGE